MNKRDYGFLEHTADVYIVAYGESLAEAFENAARATIDVMTDVKKVDPLREENVEIDAHDLKELLYNWLEELLVRFDIREMLYSKFHIEEITESERRYELKGRIAGEHFNPDKHPQLTGVKAVTYHRMEIIKEEGKITLKFILDV